MRPPEALELWDYRRRVSELYRQVRRAADPESGWRLWRDGRDELFATHTQSPIPPDRRSGFTGLEYHAYDSRWRLEAEVVPLEAQPAALGHSGAGSTGAVPFGRVDLDTPLGPVGLTLLWLEDYAGGVFLPFRDVSNGATTYGGGRYLLDTAKGADLGHRGTRILLDFNFAYHPSCVHDPRWSCPLAPPDNRLGIPVAAGERLPEVGEAGGHGLGVGSRG